MSPEPDINQICHYFDDKLKTHGATPRGADWNSDTSQETRFEQLCKVIEDRRHVSILDFGCGYGALYDYMVRQGFQIDRYVGFDILESMVEEGRRQHAALDNVMFTSNKNDIPVVDYAIASGVFNIKLQTPYTDWMQYAMDNLAWLNQIVTKGFSSNFLTSYSDPERMAERPDLFYADPCYIFDYCKKNLSRWVSINHDYRLYDFTLIVRKDDQQRA
ncbi:MAG: class I SAM-dependent methyltransferase [Anaerolineae bacterium]|nr:class I SAM-dependent methyltransferase [Anaerolineae bacterium]